MAARFELGRAYEALGSVDRAREAWQAVAAVDDSFCDVGTRLAALGSGDGADAPAAAADVTEEFESFDDLMADADEEGDDADDPAPAAVPPEAEPTAEIPIAEPDSGARKKSRAKKKSKKKISFM
jgi:hypothetical protein